MLWFAAVSGLVCGLHFAAVVGIYQIAAVTMKTTKKNLNLPS